MSESDDDGQAPVQEPTASENDEIQSRPYWGTRNKRRGAREYIALLSDNGKTLIHGLYKVASGSEPGAKARDKLEALKYLSDRYFGKTPDTVLNLNADLDAPEAEALAGAYLEAFIRQLASPAAPAFAPSSTTIDALPQNPHNAPQQAVFAAVATDLLGEEPQLSQELSDLEQTDTPSVDDDD